MKWFKFLLRHGLVVAVVVGIAIVYVYRQQLFPKFFESGTEEISVAQKADEAPSTTSDKDVVTPDAGVTSDSKDLPVVGHAEPASPAPVADRQPVVTAPIEQTHVESTATMPPSTVAPQQQVADIAETPPQAVIKATPTEAGIAIDKPASGVAMSDQGSLEANVKTAQPEQDKAVAASGSEQADAAAPNKGSIDPAKMASGMMKDPIKSMSGMMQNPSQAMSGMINPSAPDSSAAAQSPAQTKTQTATPGASPDQGQAYPGPGAYGQQRPAPTGGMQQPQSTATGVTPGQDRVYPGWPGAYGQQRPAPAAGMQQPQPQSTAPGVSPDQDQAYPGPGAYGQQRPAPTGGMQQPQPTTPGVSPGQGRAYPGWPGAYGQQRPAPTAGMQQPQSQPQPQPQPQPTTPGVSPGQGRVYPGWPGAYGQQRPAPTATAPAQTPEQSSRQEYQQIINKARQAYWQGQYPQSAKYYQQAIDLLPESPDAHGELGNLYYDQGEWDKAGESLYQAAIRLIENGRSDKAFTMLSIIRGLKHKRADELEKRLQGQRSAR